MSFRAHSENTSSEVIKLLPSEVKVLCMAKQPGKDTCDTSKHRLECLLPVVVDITFEDLQHCD